MKARSIIGIMLCLIFLFSLLSGCGSKMEPAASEPEESVAVVDLSEIQKEELLYMESLGFSLDHMQKQTVSGKEMANILDRLVEYAAPEKLEEWKDLYPAFRASGTNLTRIDVLSALFLAVQHIGGDYGYYKVDFADPMHAVLFADQEIAPDFNLFGGFLEFDLEGWGVDHYGVGGYHYNITRKSPVDNEYPLAYDKESGSFRMYEDATYAEALLAVIRAIRLAEIKTIVPLEDPAVTTPNHNILTDDLIAKANENPAVTSEDHPRWTGLALGYGDADGLGTAPNELALSAQWGFNSARVMVHYETIFDKDVTEANVDMLQKLDAFVAAAIEHDVHLNIFLCALPGRNAYHADPESGYTSAGEFDLFINEEKQELAFNVYRVLAARYKDVPNFNLSLSPLWETQNKNLSTGLPYTDYTAEDVAVFLGKAIDVIRGEDPDRLIIYEATASNAWDAIIPESAPAKTVADEKGNVMISYNFCQGAYVYACMTSAEGRHIDNTNRSMYLPNYPNYIYAVASGIWVGAPLVLDGLLPAGTTIDFYLLQSGDNTLLDISADGTSLYSEELQAAEYQTGESLSGYYPFATSEKQISVTLTEDTDEVVVSCLRDGGIDLCGIYLTLPEEYAVERWYYAQPYDVYMGLEEEEGVVQKQVSGVMISPNSDTGRRITIQDNLSYTTDYVYEEASAATINEWSQMISDFDGNCAIRFERADFSGTTWEAMSAYYEDLLKSFEEYGFSWWSNDWWLLTDEYPQTKVIAECPSTEYAGYEHFNLELLQLLQRYQSKD